MSEDDDRRRYYDRERADLVAKQVANSTAYDNAILSLSSAFLALSVAFMDDIFPSPPAWVWALYASWMLFCLSITGTVAGFIFGQAVLKRLIDGARDYYINKDETARERSGVLARRLDIFNTAVGVAFVLAVVCTLVFALANFGRSTMPNDRKVMPALVERAQPTNTFQEVPLETPKPVTVVEPVKPVQPAAQGAGQDQGHDVTQGGTDSSG